MKIASFVISLIALGIGTTALVLSGVALDKSKYKY